MTVLPTSAATADRTGVAFQATRQTPLNAPATLASVEWDLAKQPNSWLRDVARWIRAGTIGPEEQEALKIIEAELKNRARTDRPSRGTVKG